MYFLFSVWFFGKMLRKQKRPFSFTPLSLQNTSFLIISLLFPPVLKTCLNCHCLWKCPRYLLPTWPVFISCPPGMGTGCPWYSQCPLPYQALKKCLLNECMLPMYRRGREYPPIVCSGSVSKDT